MHFHSPHSSAICWALYETGKYDESLECYNKALEIDPLFKDGWYHKGVVLQKLNRDPKQKQPSPRPRSWDIRASPSFIYLEQGGRIKKTGLRDGKRGPQRDLISLKEREG